MHISAKIKAPSLTAVICRQSTASCGDIYDGNYEIIPKTEAQELSTANKLLEENIKVLAIPFYEVSNKDGTTAIIAD